MSSKITVSGTIIGSQKQAVAGLKVEAWDKDFIGKDDSLGSTTTDENGAFSISINPEDHKELFFDRKPDVYFNIYSGNDLIHSTKSEVAMNLTESTSFDISVPIDPVVEPEPPAPEPEPASTFKVDVPAGPIWSQDDAKEKAPRVAAAHLGEWTGQWNTVVSSQMSVVQVERDINKKGTHEFKTTVLAGPIWSNDEAQKVGPAIAASYGAEFTGQWNTIVQGVMSVIEIKYTF